MQNDTIKKFRQNVLAHYKAHGRHDLPWRKTHDAYHVLVSEMMLQQTQVARVIPKYKAFLKRFPTVRALARASLSEVLILWSGLGYNRRAKFLYESAQYCVQKYKAVFPPDEKLLETFPGIGPYTARAVCAFAYDMPVVFVETNIRTVYIEAFFKNKKVVSDTAILELVEKTLPKKNIRQWYSALMDYGAFLKEKGSVVHRKSTLYKKQPPFDGSLRKIRGGILKDLIGGPMTYRALQEKYGDRCHEALSALRTEGLVQQKKTFISLVD